MKEQEGVGLVLYHPEGKVLFQHRDRNISRYPNYWVIPGGSIEQEEKPIEAIKREILEETDYELCDPQLFKTNYGQVFWEVYNGKSIVCNEGQEMIFLTAEETKQRLVPEYVKRFIQQAILSMVKYYDIK